MVTLSDLRLMQDDARTLSDDLGVVTRDLTDKELNRFGRSFTRQFVRSLPTKEMVDIHLRHQKEALLGAMIAKEQMDSEIDDEIPASNKVGGPLAIRSHWLGIADDWENINGIYNGAQNAWVTGEAEDWIHSGTRMMVLAGGTAGRAIRIGGNAVHVIYGISSIHASPKVESVQFTIDGKEKSVLLLFWALKNALGHTQRIKEFDNAFILKKDTTFLAKLFFSKYYGAEVDYVTDFPMLYGVSYVKEPALRLQDPLTTITDAAAILPGARYDVVWAT